MVKQASKFAAMLPYLILACVLSAGVLTSSGLYSKSEQNYSGGSAARVCSQFLRTRLHQGDQADAIVVDKDTGVVYITEEYPEGTFRTALYYHNGWLMEQLLAEGVELDEDMGDRIVECKGFSAGFSDGVLSYSMLAEGRWQTGHVYMRGVGREE